MSQLGLAFTLLMLRIGMAFVPEQPYKEKVANIASMEEKNNGLHIAPWTYNQVTSPRDGFVHRYYRLPSRKADAPVLLMIHGLNLDARTFLGLEELADQWELIAYDLPEQTDRYQGKLEDFTAIVSEFVDLKQIRTLCVAGVSFGGGIAMQLVATRKDLDIQALLLISTAIPEQGERQRRSGMRVTHWLSKQPDYKIYWFVEKLYERTGSQYRSGNGREHVQDILRVKHPDFYRQVARSVIAHDPRRDARYVDCPVLLMIGDQDRLFSPDQAINTKKYIPQAVFRPIEGGSHAMTLNRPDVVSKNIVRFCVEEKVIDPAMQHAAQ
jgi:pimeloyl-ACP methyl ester carboxylesterase